LAEVSKEFDKMQKQHKKDTLALNNQIKKLEKRGPSNTGGSKAVGGGVAGAQANADNTREVAMVKKDFEKKLKAAEKKIDTLEKKLKKDTGA